MWRKEREGAMAGKRNLPIRKPALPGQRQIYSAAAAALMSFAVSARPATEDDHPRVTAV
jgi:hypothetical protein